MNFDDDSSTIPFLLATVVTLVLTVGLTWIFYPALSAVTDVIEWNEVEMSSSDSTTKNEIVLLSLIVPAYNEQDRIARMIESSHAYLSSKNGLEMLQKISSTTTTNVSNNNLNVEWVFVNDGSTDATTAVIEQTYQKLMMKQRIPNNKSNSNSYWRVLSLTQNSGKGAAVKTGMLNARGKYRLMVDADGATEFGPGLERLVDVLLLQQQQQQQQQNEKLDNSENMKIAIFGSRAHLAKESGAQRSLVRTILMYGFHFFVRILVSNAIQDTQCGFKLLSKEAALASFDKLHLRRWAFDTELLIRLSRLDIPVHEVGVPWQEVDGSKLNTSKFSLAWVSLSMLRDMVCVRACYTLGIWSSKK